MLECQPLPDHVLEKQTCTNCFQYLSVLPVNQNKKGEIYCGRCKADFEKTLKHIPSIWSQVDEISNSIFNVVAKKYLFKCVNHYEGCRKLLDVNNSEEHEEECQYQPHECFFCSFHGNWCQIVNHCLKQHSSNVTKNGLLEFEVGKQFLQKLIFIIKNNIFLLTIESTEEKLSLIISPEVKDNFVINQFALKFFEPLDSDDAQFIFTDYSLFDINCINYFEKNNDDLILRFGRNTKINCQILLKQVVLAQKEFELEKRLIDFNVREKKIFKQEKFMKKWENALTEQNQSLQSLSDLIKKLLPTYFTCVKCNKIAAEVMYFCPKNHCFCEECLSGTCQTCNKICEFINVTEIDKIVVTCDWPNCLKSVRLRNYLDHKRNCLLRPYKCPLKECPEIVYSCENLITHWHCRMPPLVCDNIIEYDTPGDYESYWLLNSNLFHVVIQFSTSTDKLQVIVEETLVLQHNCRFEVEGFSIQTKKWEKKTGSYLCDKFIVTSTCSSPQGYRFNQLKLSALNA